MAITMTMSIVIVLGRFIPVVLLFLGNGGTGNRVLTIDPSTQVDEAATVAAKGERRQEVDRGNLVRFGTGWAASPDHGSLFGEGVVAGLAGSLLDAGDDSVADFDSVAGLAGSLDDLSACSAFLYESLR